MCCNSLILLTKANLLLDIFDELKWVILCPPSLTLLGWCVPVLLCPDSSRLWEKPADVNAPIPPWITGLQSLLKMRYEWRGGGGQHDMFFLLWDWGTGCEDGVFFFFPSPIFWLLSILVIQFFQLVIFPSPSCHPLWRAKCYTGRYKHHHPCTLPIHPINPTFCFFDYLCFYRTLMAVLRHIVMC